MKTLKQIIQNILADQLIKTELYEFASSRQEIKRKIEDLIPQITEHLMYLKLYPNSRTRAHWRTEIRTWIFKFSDETLKSNNKKLDANTYFEFLYNIKYEDNIDRLIKIYKEAIKKEGKIKVEFDIVEFDKQLQKFYKNLAVLCSVKKTVMDEDIMELLDEWEK